jgi:hypothetical protein
MDILSTLLASAQSGSLSQAAQARGIGNDGAAALLKQLVPALTAQVKRNASSKDGLGSLAAALSNGRHEHYLDNAAALTTSNAIDDGNGILGHILGSKDASRKLAAHAASQTGIDVGMIKQFLPIIAAATMGAMSKSTSGGQSGLGSLVGKFLDADGDGNVVDDLLSLGKKFL